MSYLGRSSGQGGGLIHGDSASPMIFNIVVDAEMQAVLDVVCVPQEAQQGLWWVAGDRNLIFYADGDTIAGQDHECFQDAPLVTVVMYHIMGLGKILRTPRPWSTHKVTSEEIGGRKRTSDGRREKGQRFGRERGCE